MKPGVVVRQGARFLPYCFAGCGAGSIIDFYMLYQKQVEDQDCDFKTAVTDLAEILLQ